MNYASSLEPWRSCISVLTDDILNGARALERIVNSTVEGCTELNSRVVALEAELYNMRMENEILRVKISELASPQKCNLSKIQIEEEADASDSIGKHKDTQYFGERAQGIEDQGGF